MSYKTVTTAFFVATIAFTCCSNTFAQEADDVQEPAESSNQKDPILVYESGDGFDYCYIEELSHLGGVFPQLTSDIGACVAKQFEDSKQLGK